MSPVHGLKYIFQKLEVTIIQLQYSVNIFIWNKKFSAPNIMYIAYIVKANHDW